MATPEENKAAALERAADARLLASEAAAKGDIAKMEMYQKRVSTWEASAERYDRIIAAKQRIETAKANIEAIKERISATPQTSTPIITPNPVVINPKGSSNTGYTGGSYTPDYSTTTTTPSAPPPPSPTPPVIPPPPPPPPPPVKTAPIDTILYPSDDLLPVEIMSDLIFENIGGQELINIARNDTVNGQQVVYQPIKNLTQIQQQYNPNNIVALQDTSDKYFQNFAIKLETKVPEEGTGPAGAHVYIDPETGDLVVEAINLEPDEQVELEITLSGTIYEAEL